MKDSFAQVEVACRRKCSACICAHARMSVCVCVFCKCGTYLLRGWMGARQTSYFECFSGCKRGCVTSLILYFGHPLWSFLQAGRWEGTGVGVCVCVSVCACVCGFQLATDPDEVLLESSTGHLQVVLFREGRIQTLPNNLSAVPYKNPHRQLFVCVCVFVCVSASMCVARSNAG